MIIAIIPAKENSEGVPKKNSKKLGGRELIRYTLEAALASKYIDYVFVTTDSSVIDGIVREYTASTAKPHVKTRVLTRPTELTQSHVQVDEVVLFSLRQIQLLGYEPDTVVVLQPTSPFRTTEHIDEAIELHAIVDNDTIIGVGESGYAYGVEGADLYAIGHSPMHRLGRQESEYDSVVTENGALYIVRASNLSRYRSFRAFPMVPFYMDWVSSLEVDEPLQWSIAEVLVDHVYNS